MSQGAPRAYKVGQGAGDTLKSVSAGEEGAGAGLEEFPVLGVGLQVLGGITSLASTLYDEFHKAPTASVSSSYNRATTTQVGADFSNISAGSRTGAEVA